MTQTKDSTTEEREALARLFDPGAFTGVGDLTYDGRAPRRVKALGKADEVFAILSGPSRMAASSEGEPVAWVVFATGGRCKGGRKIDHSRKEVEQYGREFYGDGDFEVSPLYAHPAMLAARPDAGRE